MTMNELMDIIYSIVFIGMLENFFLMAYIMIKLEKPFFNERILSIVFFISCICYILDNTETFFMLNLVIRMLVFVGTICIFYAGDDISPKYLLRYFLQALSFMFIIQTIVYLLMSEFLGLNVEVVRQDVVQTIYWSIPTRISEMIFIYVFYLKHANKNGRKKNVKKID